MRMRRRGTPMAPTRKHGQRQGRGAARAKAQKSQVAWSSLDPDLGPARAATLIDLLSRGHAGSRKAMNALQDQLAFHVVRRLRSQLRAVAALSNVDPSDKPEVRAQTFLEITRDAVESTGGSVS